MSINFGIVTVSDRSSRGERADASGPLLVEAVKSRGWTVVNSAILPDEKEEIISWLKSMADTESVDVILTTGGTGFAHRDITPEATLAVVDRLAPGIPEAMRAASLTVTPHAMLSRMVAGMRARTLIINLPGSPKGALENFEVIAPVLDHAVQLLKGDPDSEKGHLVTKL